MQNLSPNLVECRDCGVTYYQNDRIPEGICRNCHYEGKPDARIVPYAVGDIVRPTFAPRTTYRILEIREANFAYRTGGVKIVRCDKNGKALRPENDAHTWDNSSIIEWRKANMKKPTETELSEAVDWAARLWDKGVREYRESLRKAKQCDDPGTCVLGAGIEILGIDGKQIAFIHVPKSAGQGATTWETSVYEVVAYLRSKGLDARYEGGRSD